MTSDETIRKAVEATVSALEGHGMEQCSHSAPGFHRRWIQCSCDETVEYADVSAWEVHRAEEAVRALYEAGLLANLDGEVGREYIGIPADQLTEEFGAQVRGGVRTLPDGYRDVGSHHRYVTEWLPVDGVDRAEGTGGKAAKWGQR